MLHKHYTQTYITFTSEVNKYPKHTLCPHYTQYTSHTTHASLTKNKQIQHIYHTYNNHTTHKPNRYTKQTLNALNKHNTLTTNHTNTENAPHTLHTHNIHIQTLHSSGDSGWYRRISSEDILAYALFTGFLWTKLTFQNTICMLT